MEGVPGLVSIASAGLIGFITYRVLTDFGNAVERCSTS